jgi:hypothetical protein
MKAVFNIRLAFMGEARDEEQFEKFLRYAIEEGAKTFDCQTAIITLTKEKP